MVDRVKMLDIFEGNTYRLSVKMANRQLIYLDSDAIKPPNDTLLKLLGLPKYLEGYCISLRQSKVISKYLTIQESFLYDQLNCNDQALAGLLGDLHFQNLYEAWTSRRCLQRNVLDLMSNGLSRDTAEAVVAVYGEDALLEYLKNPLIALTFMQSVSEITIPSRMCDDSASKELCGMLLWFEQESHQGRTVICRDTVPLAFQISLASAVCSGWIKQSGDNYQLLSNFILETSTRINLGLFSRSFQHVFSDLEISAAYNRIMMYQNSFFEPHTANNIREVINRKILNIVEHSRDQLLRFIDPLTELTTLLTARESVIITYSESSSHDILRFNKHWTIRCFYSPTFAERTDELDIGAPSIPNQKATPKTYYVLDFDLYNISDFSVLLEKIMPHDQLILVTPKDGGLHPAEFKPTSMGVPYHQLGHYYPTFTLPGQHVVRPTRLGKFNSFTQLLEKLSLVPRLPIIAFDKLLIESLNFHLSMGTGPVIVQDSSNFSKGDFILFDGIGHRNYDLIIGECMHPGGTNMLIKTDGRFSLLAGEFFLRSHKRLAHAVTHSEARKANIKNVYILKAVSLNGPYELFSSNTLPLCSQIKDKLPDTIDIAERATQLITPRIE